MSGEHLAFHIMNCVETATEFPIINVIIPLRTIVFIGLSDFQILDMAHRIICYMSFEYSDILFWLTRRSFDCKIRCLVLLDYNRQFCQ
jgi:hypothetical protein